MFRFWTIIFFITSCNVTNVFAANGLFVKHHPHIHLKLQHYLYQLIGNDTDVTNALVLLLVPLAQLREGRKWLKRNYVSLLTVNEVFNDQFDDSDLLSGLGSAGLDQLFGFASSRLYPSLRQFTEAFRKVGIEVFYIILINFDVFVA